jgi:hypothetical protein
MSDRPYVDVGLPTLLDASPPDPQNPRQAEHDGYPDVIVDQRHAYGCETVEEIELFWLETLERSHVPLHATDPLDEVDAYINRARLLADCPGCNAGAFVWNRNPLACCLDCGLLFKVRFPSPFVLAAAIRLLAVRPVVNCNWNAHKGETVTELERENRWLLNEPSVEKNGLVVPTGLDVPDALARYIDPQVA